MSTCPCVFPPARRVCRCCMHVCILSSVCCILMCARVYVCGCMHTVHAHGLGHYRASVHVDSGALLAQGDEPAYSADKTSAGRTGGVQQGGGRGAVEEEISRAAMEEEASRAAMALLGHVADKLWRPQDASVLKGVVVGGHEFMVYVVVGGHEPPRGGQAGEGNGVANGGEVQGRRGMDWMAQLRPPQSCHLHNGRLLSVQVGLPVLLSLCSPSRSLSLSLSCPWRSPWRSLSITLPCGDARASACAHARSLARSRIGPHTHTRALTRAHTAARARERLLMCLRGCGS